MFDRFTERARRVIFFARYEASTFGSSYIETEHLLLGLLREDKVLSGQLSLGAKEAIRGEVEALATHPIERIPTSVDLPLSHDSKRALAYGAEESERFKHKFIDCGHLVLGLLRMENCTAAELLKRQGIDLTNYRSVVDKSQAESPPLEPRISFQPISAAASALKPTVGALERLVESASEHLDAYTYADGEARLKRKPWSRKQALGHLIDWASTHQQWFARALTEPALLAPGYPADEWVSAQQYESAPWRDVVDLWVSQNRFLVHVLAEIPEEKLNTPCRIGVDEPVPLSRLIARYVEYCEDLVGQILSRL